MNTPHYPYQGYAKWIKYYRDKGVKHPRDLYAAFLTTQDEKIGALIGLLEENNLREDTIIIFQSDNGHSTETRAYHGGGYTDHTGEPSSVYLKEESEFLHQYPGPVKSLPISSETN